MLKFGEIYVEKNKTKQNKKKQIDINVNIENIVSYKYYIGEACWKYFIIIC